MTVPLPPVPGPQITENRAPFLTPAWLAWFNQLYTYVTAGSGGGGGVVPYTRNINTTAPLTGGGTLAADLTLSIQANGITNALLAQMAATTLKGNNTAVSATPSDLTAAQVTAMLNLFTTSLRGLVPGSGGGTTNFLRADAIWAAPAYPVGANPTGSVGLAAVNGVATTFLRSDGAPALSQEITPTWTGQHIFSPASGNPIVVDPAATTAGIVINGATNSLASLKLVGGRTGTKAWELAADPVTAGTMSVYSDGDAVEYLQFIAGKTAPMMKAYGPTAAALVDATVDTGTVTLTPTGVTSPSPATVTGTWARFGNLVIWQIPACTGTSNSTAFTFTGTIPSAIVPETTRWSPVTLIEDAGSVSAAQMSASVSGSAISFAKNGSTSGFTNSATTKGISSNTSFAYNLN